MLIPVLGMDPSLNNWGLAHGHYDTESGLISIESLDVIQPLLPTGKQTRNNSKDLGRARQLAEQALAHTQTAAAIFVEVPVGSQNARAMASYGVCIGILASLNAQGIAFYEVTPLEVKQATVGAKTASKLEIITRAVQRYPKAPWPTETKKGEQRIILSKAEHMADAIGAIEAGVHTEDFKRTLQIWNSNQRNAHAN